MTDNPFVSIESKLIRLERLLMELRDNIPTQSIPADDFLNLKEASEFLNVAPQTIYQNIKKLPHMKRFRKLAFKRSELVKYLEEGAIQGKKKGGKL